MFQRCQDTCTIQYVEMGQEDGVLVLPHEKDGKRVEKGLAGAVWGNSESMNRKLNLNRLGDL